MAVIVSHRIRESEFPDGISGEHAEVIRRTARVVLATPLAGKGLPPGTRLLKAYATSPKGPRRIVYLLVVDDNDLFLIFYRDKNDPVGSNISPKNPAFAAQLKKHLGWLRDDINAGRFEELDGT